MDTIWAFLNAISPLYLGVGIAVTAALMTVILDWRLSLFAMVVQFLFVSLLLNAALPGGLALAKLIAGSMACLMLYWSTRQIEHALDRMSDGHAWFVNSRDLYPMGLPFRFLVLLLVALALFAVPQLLSLTFLPRYYLVPASWLIALGLLTIILTRDPLRAALGLMTFQNGFDLLYHQFEVGLLVLALLGIGTIMIGLIASYLALARYLPTIDARQLVADPSSPQALAEAVAALDQRPSDASPSLAPEASSS